MGLKEFYYKLEDKYFEMLDNLEEKGINLYKIVDPLEKNGIPTFPIYLLLILAVIALIIFLLLPVVGITGRPDGTELRFVDETSNPFENITLSVTLNDTPKTLITDDDGRVYIKNLDKTQIYILKLTDTIYSLSGRDSLEINPTNKKGYLVSLEELPETTTKTISFKTKTGEPVTSELTVEFSCLNTDYVRTATVTGGSHTLNDVPRDCGTMDVDVKERPDFEVNIPATGTTGEVLFSSEYTTATLVVTVKEKDKDIVLPNMSVTITENGITVDTGQTNASGIFTSELVHVSKTYNVLVSDELQSIYSPITESDYVNGLQTPVKITNGLNNISLAVKKDVIGFIQIKVKDRTTGTFLEGVSAKLSKSGSTIETKTTDSTGIVKFGVKDNLPYYLTLDKEGYLVDGPRPIAISTDIKEISLTSIDATSTNPVNISVTDNLGSPLEYATVKIWDVANNEMIKTVSTDVSGRVTISNLSPGTYFAEASVGSFSGRSNNFDVINRVVTEVLVPVTIGQGVYNLTVLGSDGTALSGLTVKTYDASKNTEMTEKQTTTTETGLAVIPVRADKSVFFVIENDGRRIVTKQYSVLADGLTTDTIYLPTNISSSAGIDLIGYYASNGDQLASVGAGQSVTARFVLNVDKRYSKVIAHIRTGDGDTCGTKTYSITDDSIYIKQIKYAGTKMYGSIDYTPCLGETKDTTSIVKKDGKWFNVVLDNPIEGSYIIDADIVVTDTATSNQSLFYRAEFQQGTSVLRNPIDNVLGSSVTSSSKQALYAYAKTTPIYVGDSTGCENGICYTFTIKDKTTGVEKRIMDKFTAKDGTDYILKFRLTTERPANDAVMIVTTAGQTIKLNNYTITPGGNLPITDTDFSNITLGSISANGTITGEIDLSVLNDITDDLTITLLSNSETILTKKILFDLKPSKKLVVDIVPKTIVPFVPNTMSIGVTDETGLAVFDAIVLTKINGKSIVDGKTGKDGVYSFLLPSPNVGDNVEIIVRKQNYSTHTTNLKVSENLISTIPETLEVQLDISESYSNKSDVILLNNTILPLTITNIQANINSEYVKITSNASGMVLEPNSESNIEISTKLTEIGIDLMTQKVIKGNLLITVNEATLGKSWIIEVPVNVRITFGNAVDSTDCLEIDPEETTIRVENTNDLEYTIKVKNTCSVDNVPVEVGRIYVESDYKNTKKLGDFYAVVSGREYKLALDEKIEVLPRIDADKTADIKLIFKINNSVKSGVSTPIIKITSNRPNTNGIDVLESQHKPKIIFNNYLTCIETPTTPVIVPYCSGFGYGILGGNSMNWNQAMLGTNMYATNGQSPTTYMQTPLYNNPYSFTNSNMSGYYNNFTEPAQAGYPTAGFGNVGQFGCQEAKIQIKNNCYEELALQFTSVGGVTVSSNPEMTLKKGESKLLGVQGATILGQYKIAMSAKPNDDTIEEYTYVKDIPVTVNRPVEILPENCISVVPTKFDFSSIDTTPKKLTIINSCYDAGYALISLNVLNPAELMVDDIQYFSIGDVNETLKPKKSYRIIDGKTNEIMTIGIRRNPEINEKAFRTDSNGSIAKKVTNIRLDYFDLGKAINKKAQLGIIYSSPRMSNDEYDQEITLTDNLQWLAYLDALKDTSSTLDGNQTSTITSTITCNGSVCNGTCCNGSCCNGTCTNGVCSGTSTTDQNITNGSIFSDYFAGTSGLEEGKCYDPKGLSQKGLTGKDNYDKYGFNRLLFSYNESDIQHNTCDYGQVYCDQDQLRIAMSKKAIKLLNSSEFIDLNGTKFRKENNMIAANILATNPVDKKTIEDAAKTYLNSSANTSAQITSLKTVINTVPKELQRYTIIEINIETNKQYVGTITNNQYYTPNGTTIYQFTVESFMANQDKMLTETDQEKVSDFLYQFLSSMKIYYGDTLSPFIINAKTYGSLEGTALTPTIFATQEFASSAWKVQLKDSTIKSIDTPGTYLITLENPNATLTTVNYKVNRIESLGIDYYSKSDDYKLNIFFKNPTNAHYYNYSGIKFKEGFVGKARQTTVLSSYASNWKNIQDNPYILMIPTSQNGMVFKDIRPIQAVATQDYAIEYLASGQYNLIRTTNRKDTIFALYDNQKDRTSGADYQLKISSQVPIKFNVTPATLSAVGSYSNVYGIPYNLNGISKYKAEETSSVSNMVIGISNKTMCFDFVTDGFVLWYNPQNTVKVN